ERPLGNIFNLYVLLSMLLQFALHIISLIYITIQTLTISSLQYHYRLPEFLNLQNLVH
ncbi:uncharacterized protein F5147DRAFT_582984, partial [Suillus discolor]